MAYARKTSRARKQPAKRRPTRMGGGRYTTRGAYSRTPVRRRPVTRRRAVRRQGTPFNAYALAHVDPFDDRCKGVKVPDANTMPSVAFCVNQETNVQMTSVNANAHVFLPAPACQEVYALNKNLGSNTWYWGALSTDTTLTAAQQVQNIKLAAIASAYDLVRPVAHGIRLSCGLSPTTVTGFAHVAIVARPTLLAATVNEYWPTSIAEMGESPWYKRIPLATLTQRPLTVVNKILDTSSQTYSSPKRAYVSETAVETGSVAIAQSMAFAVLNQANFDRDSLNGFACIVVAVEGAPSGSSPLVIEQMTHYEAIPKSTGLQAGGMSAPSRPDVLAGVSHMAASTPAEHFEGEEPGVIARAAQAFHAGAAQATGGMTEAFVSAAGQVGYAATRHAFGRMAGAFAGGADLPGLGPANRLLN